MALVAKPHISNYNPPSDLPPIRPKTPTRLDYDVKCPFNSFRDCYQDRCACWDVHKLMCIRH